jgi:hypothetical protein
MKYRLIFLLLFIVLLHSCGNRSSKEQARDTAISNGQARDTAISKKEEASHEERDGDLKKTLVTTPFSGHNSDIRREDYDYREPYITSSPDEARQIALSAGEKATDFVISPTKPLMIVLTEQANGQSCIKIWDIGIHDITAYRLPEGFKGKSIDIHPVRDIFFVLGIDANGEHKILRISQTKDTCQYAFIFSSAQALKRLVVGTLPFHMPGGVAYRLYMGMEYEQDKYRIVTVTEYGERFYQVIGPKESITTAEELDSDFEPSDLTASYSLPVDFHPTEHQMIWEDEQHNLYHADYDTETWGRGYHKLSVSSILNGSIALLPNGLGVVCYKEGRNGVGIYLFHAKKETIQAENYSFASTPKPLADGKGIAGTVVSGDDYMLHYVPVDIPFGDVVNAGQYINSQEELDLFTKNYGLFYSTDMTQIYQIYETERYSNYSQPVLVTTDVMWEIFGAAYQGVFVVNEKEIAIPAFLKFTDEAYQWLKKNNTSSPWIPVFETIKALQTGEENDEAARILAEKDCYSELIANIFAYSEMKPRGHYVKSKKAIWHDDESEYENDTVKTKQPDMENYFRAFKYFTSIYQSNNGYLRQLNDFPTHIKDLAAKWVNSYFRLISPSRAHVVLDNINNTIPEYCRQPSENLTIFPLSWGWDNEILFSTVNHFDLPSEEQIISKERTTGRGNPSGLDLAAVAGNRFADRLLEPEYDKYPNLQQIIANIRNNFSNRKHESDNIYNQWIDAIAVQWADGLLSQNGEKDRELWQIKRLQTGLASWATLRHATILVNEKFAAEGGEGGFETLITRPARGSVEPDPNTFSAIAGLFNAMAKYVSDMVFSQTLNDEQKKLFQNIETELKNVVRIIKQFQIMAEKTLKNEELTENEYSMIRNIDGIVEHNFLKFNSLMQDDYGIADPDPMAKIADVSYDKTTGLQWMVAVGNPMGWNHIVPFYGRRQIVKGSIYSYYEFTSARILNDEEWRQMTGRQEILPWIKPYMIQK